MQDGLCSRCASDTVYVDRKAQYSGLGPLHVDFWHVAPLTAYVCTTCGYVECFVERGESRTEIGQKWQHVKPGGTRD
jgi:hypothetical protein